MFWRPKLVQSQGSRAVHDVLVATLLVASLAMFMMLTAGATQACPASKEASGSVSVVHKAECASAMMSATSAQALAERLSWRRTVLRRCRSLARRRLCERMLFRIFGDD